jgi:hypothetical protein
MSGRGTLSLKLGVFTVAACLACGASAAGRGHAGIGPRDGEWLFKHAAKHGTLRPIAGSNQLRLTLKGTAPTVRAITRGSGPFDVQSLADFVHAWKAYGFARTPPNAAIVAPGQDPAHDVLLARLSAPRLGKGGLSYAVKPIRGRTPADLSHFAQVADASLPVQLGKADVYLDDANDDQQVLTINFDTQNAWTGTMTLSSPVGLEAHVISGSAQVRYRPPSPYPAWSPPSQFYMDIEGPGLVSVETAVNPTGNCLMVDMSTQNPLFTRATVTGPFGDVLKDGVNLVSSANPGPCTN